MYQFLFGNSAEALRNKISKSVTKSNGFEPFLFNCKMFMYMYQMLTAFHQCAAQNLLKLFSCMSLPKLISKHNEQTCSLQLTDSVFLQGKGILSPIEPIEPLYYPVPAWDVIQDSNVWNDRQTICNSWSGCFTEPINQYSSLRISWLDVLNMHGQSKPTGRKQAGRMQAGGREAGGTSFPRTDVGSERARVS